MSLQGYAAEDFGEATEQTESLAADAVGYGDVGSGVDQGGGGHFFHDGRDGDALVGVEAEETREIDAEIADLAERETD